MAKRESYVLPTLANAQNEKGLAVQVDIVNLATPYLIHLAERFPNSFRKALKSTGYWLTQEIKEGIQSGAPGGQRYKKFSWLNIPKPDAIKHSHRGTLESYSGGLALTKGGVSRKPKQPLGKLKQAIRYQYYSDSNRVVLGWIGKSAEYLGTYHEKGFSYPVTGKARRFFWALGIPMSKGHSRFYIPARPTIGPIYKHYQSRIPAYMEDRIMSHLFDEEGV
jgi:hypothetical protein